MAPQTHRIFYDEDIYANMGQNMALKNQTGYCNYGTFEYGEYHPHWISYNKQPSGWPFLISLVFQFLGTDERYAFFLNNVLFSAGVLVVFSITWHLCEVFFTAFIAALAFSIIPHNLIWANTAATETSAGLLTGIVVLSLIVFLKRKKDRHLFLLMLLIPFACQMRSESLLILGWVLISILLYSPRILAEKRLWTLGLLTTVFLLPHILH
ncbi:MAG: glycosyltransferase family 39 protein, partial [Desulfatiglandaceae bacterium]